MATETRKEVVASDQPRSETLENRGLTLFRPLEEAEQLFERLLPRDWLPPIARNWPMWGGFTAVPDIRVPKVDVVDRDKEVLVRLEVPGVDKKDLEVSVSGSSLIIKGSTKRETKEESPDYFRCEIAQGNFARTLALPEGVDPAGVTASLKDGLLEIVLPKTEDVQRRSVEVK